MKVGTGYYDLSRCSPTWNALDFGLGLEMWRLQQGLDRLQVRVLPGPVDGFRADRLPPFGADERRAWLSNIVLPLFRMLPSCGEDAELVGRDDKPAGPEWGRDRYTIGFKWNVMAANANIYPFRAIPDLRSYYQSLHGRRYVTITLRESTWHPKRTSNLADWLEIGCGLRERGFDVVFVRDAVKAREPLPDFVTEPQSSLKCVYRAALYAGAVMNLGISNGPLWFAWFMGVPVMIFGPIAEQDQFLTDAGMPIGGQLANAKPGQRIFWHGAEPAAVLKSFDQEIVNVVSGNTRAA